MWDLSSWPGIQAEHLQWKCRFLTTGPPGKSLMWFFPCSQWPQCFNSWPLFACHFRKKRACLAQTVKNLTAMQEIWVRSLCWEDPLEKGVATHSSIHAWRIPWAEGPGGLQSMELERVRHDWETNTFTFIVNLQCCWFLLYSKLSYTPIYILYILFH